MPGDFVRSTEKFPMIYFEIYNEEIHGKRFRDRDDEEEVAVIYDPWKILKERRIIND